MSLFHDINEDGYTVKELADHLQDAIAAGEGTRRVMVGPTGGEDSNQALAIRIVGIEANKEDDGGENDIFWLYPGDINEWM